SGKETITYSGGYAYLSAEGKITAYPAGENEKIDKTKLADVWVRGIAVDKEGGAWIVRSGSYSYLENVGGRIDYVSASGEVKKYTGKALLGDTLTDNSEIRTVMVDAAGGLWFGTSGNGVVYCEDLKTVSKVYNSKTAAWAENKSLDNIYCTANIDGTLYVGSNGGVSFMNVAMPEETALSIYKGEQLFSEMTNSRLQSITKLEGQQHYQYAGYNTYPTWKTFKNDQGPTIAGIFKSAGIDIEAIEADQQITFVGADGVKSSFTKEQLFADRYFYPNGKEGTEKGSVGGSLAQEGKVNVPATLNLNNEGGTLQYGQRLPNEQTVDGFTKYIAQGGKIIIGDKAESWTAITGISHVSGTTVTPGTKISLDLPPANGEAKVFYTLDGSTPNAASTMYNYQANRWGGSKNEIVLNEEGEVTLKVVVINRGKKDSGVSTFNYTVKKNTAKPDPDPTPNPDPLPVPDPVPVPGPLPTEGVGEGNEKRPETTDKRTKTETVATNKPEEEQAPVSPKAKDLNQWMKQITLDVSIGGKASSLDEAAKMDLLKSLLTEADYVALEGGEALAVNIAMEFNSNKVSAEEKKEMEEAVKARNLNILSFVDISVKKKLGDGQWENIHKTQKPLTLTIDVPTEYQKENTLCLIRLHEGNLTILQDEDGNKGTITIKSDAFSPYALAVDATEKGFPWLWIIIPIGIIGLITYIGLFRKKKAKI
ncbi:MAG: FN3 associated domain-containing protein, partial [Anaerovoracaceae bacterium]